VGARKPLNGSEMSGKGLSMKEVQKDVLCPWCGDRHDRATEILGSGSPDDGDATICWTCTNIAVFESSVTGGLRKPNDIEAENLHRDTPLGAARAALARSPVPAHRHRFESP